MALKRYIEDLPCKLTEGEWKERATSLAHKHRELGEFQERAKLVKKELKEDEDKLQISIDKLGEIVRTNHELRAVEVREEMNVGREIIEVIRQDTGEFVRSRPLSQAELQDLRQGKLPLGDDDDSPKRSAH